MDTYRSPNQGRTVWVRLSDVPATVRQTVAEQMVKQMGLTTFEALELMMAALEPKQDPGLWVDEEAVENVVMYGKRPRGTTPVFA